MGNLSIKTDLLKIAGAFVTKIKGKTSTKRCLVIPLDGNEELFIGEKGIYLNAIAIEMHEPRYGDTHIIKVNLDKEIYGKLTDEQKNAIPIIGTMKPIAEKQMEVNNTIDGVDNDDLPF